MLDQLHVFSLFGRKPSTGIDQFFCRAGDKPGQSLRSARSGNDRKPCFRKYTARLTAILISQAREFEFTPPTAVPFSAAMTGCGRASMDAFHRYA